MGGGGCEEVNGISQLSMENVHTIEKKSVIPVYKNTVNFILHLKITVLSMVRFQN